MDFTYTDPTAWRGRGPALYFGYCPRTRRFRMMDFAEYMASLQEGVVRWSSDLGALYGDVGRSLYAPSGYGGPAGQVHPGHGRCDEGCRCECHVCDADLLIYARCGEVRNVLLTFDNDTHRERQVTLELGAFATADGHAVGWPAAVTPESFTLRPCGEQTITLRVEIDCPEVRKQVGSEEILEVAGAGRRDVDRCEVAYATLRAGGCQVRPIVVAVAIVPHDCLAYHSPCRCGCC